MASKKSNNPEGRPTVFTPENIQKLEEVFAIDGTVEEACFYAGISKSSYYNLIEKKPEYLERFEALRQRPVLKARETIVKDLANPEGARWYISKKKRAEFGSNEEMPMLQKNTANIYNFFISPEIQAQVKTMEDQIKLALTQPRNVQP